MFLAGRNQLMARRSLTEAIRIFNEMGYGGLELSVTRGMTQAIVLDYLDDYVIKEVNDLCDELSFPITALAIHQNFVTNEDVYNAHVKLLKSAKKYRTKVLITSTGIDLRQRELNPDIYDLMAKKTRELCNIAEDNDALLAIEIEPNMICHNLKRFFELAEKVKSPALKMNLDVGHIYLSEVDLIKAIDDSKDFIAYSHIENMVMGEHCHKLPWEGDIDLLKVYKKLKDTCYDGPVSLDIYIQDYETAAPKCLEYINREIFSKI